MAIDYVSLGARVRKLRKQRGISMAQLAVEAGVSPSFLGHVERGSRKASLETLARLCSVLSTTPNYLLQDSFPSMSKITKREAEDSELLNRISNMIDEHMGRS